MAKVKLQTKHEYKFGQTNIVPFAGAVTFDKEGIFEVEEQYAQKLVDLNIGFNHFKTSKVTTTTTEKLKQKAHLNEALTSTTTQEITETTTEAVVDETTIIVETSVEESEKQAMLESLNSMTLVQLREQVSIFPEAEWAMLKKAELLEYLKSKLV